MLIAKCCFMLFNTFANPFYKKKLKTMGNTALRPLATFFFVLIKFNIARFILFILCSWKFRELKATIDVGFEMIELS